MLAFYPLFLESNLLDPTAIPMTKNLQFGMETLYTIPSDSFLHLPREEPCLKKIEVYCKFVTDLLHDKFPKDPKYFQTLTKEELEELNREKSLYQLLENELPSEGDREIAFYAGTFDPFTNGHLELVRHASKIYKSLVIGVGSNPQKTPLLEPLIRKELIEESLRNRGIENVTVVLYGGKILTVKMAANAKAGILLRGIRNLSDVKEEIILAWINQVLHPKIQTVLMTQEAYREVSSSKLKDDLASGKEIFQLAPIPVLAELLKPSFQKIKKDIRVIGLVGGIGSGKSTLLNALSRKTNVEVVDLDKVCHKIGERKEVISQLALLFGNGIVTHGKIDRPKLRSEVFEKSENRFLIKEVFEKFLIKEIFTILNKMKQEQPELSLLILEGITLIESGMYRLLDEVWFLEAPIENCLQRVLKDPTRIGLEEASVKKIMEHQAPILTFSKKKAHFIFDNSTTFDALLSQVENHLQKLTECL